MDFYLTIAQNNIASGQLVQAEEIIAKAEATGEEKTQRYYHIKGYYYFKQSNFDKALEMFEKIRLDHPILKEAMHTMVEAYRKLDRFEEAMKIAEAGVNQYSDYYKGYSLRGSVYADKKKHNEAIADFKKAIELNSNSKEAKQNIVWSYCQLNDYNTAMNLYDKYLKSREKDNILYVQFKGKILSHFGKYNEALEEIEKTLMREPYNPKFQRDKVICCYNLGKYSECIEIGELLLTQGNPKTVESLLHLNFYIGLSYLKRDKNLQKSEELMKKYKDVVPEDKRDKEYFLEEGKRLLEVGDDKGIDFINKVLEMSPDYLPAIICKYNHLELISKNERKEADEKFLEDNKEYANKVIFSPNEMHCQSLIGSEMSFASSTSAIQGKHPTSIQIPVIISPPLYKQQDDFVGQNNSIAFGNQGGQEQVNKNNLTIIGEGGFAIVSLQSMGNEMAVMKTLKIESDQLIQLNEQEKSILSKFDHPNIVKYRGFYKNSILMEYCEGKDLYSLLIKRKNQVTLPVKFKYKVIKQVADALSYIHSQGIIHGDIKTLNILLDKNWNPNNSPNAKLSDFGLSSVSKDANKSKGWSILYAPPEVLNSKYPISVQSDIYSFGMTIYEIIKQETPFLESQLESQVMKTFVEDSVKRGIHPKFNEVINSSMCCKELIELMERMCEVNPNKRPTIQQVNKEVTAIYNSN